MEHLLSLFVRSIFVDNMIFAFFLGMPFYTKLDKDKPVPERVTMSTTKQKVMFFVYVAITLIGSYLFAVNI